MAVSENPFVADDVANRYEPKKDQLGQRTLSDTRKLKLTLMHINKLKKIRATSRLEQLQRQELISMMYSPPAEEEGSGGMM
jgi:hypothetical protein